MALPIGFLSLAKVALFIATLVILLTGSQALANSAFFTKPVTTLLIFLSLALYAASLAWTSGSQVEAFNSMGKYGKLLTIPIFCLMIRSQKEALLVLACFCAAQLFLLMSAWMLFFQMPVPWATSEIALSHHVVFSSYLDESLMSAVFAAVCWHLRALVPGQYGRYCAIAVCLFALGNVFFLLQGRSAHVVAILLLTLAIAWQLPRQYRLFVVVVPFVIVAVLYASSTTVQTRLNSLKNEVQSFSFQKGVNVHSNNSSGIRLHFWRRALQSMSENPVLGSGAGSWSNEFNRLERIDNPEHKDINPLGNPHQEYLLWGVQLGAVGMLLLFALMISVIKDTLPIDIQTARAAQSSLAALAIACLFNSSIYDAQIGDFFSVVLGLLLALGIQSKQQMQELNHRAINAGQA